MISDRTKRDIFYFLGLCCVLKVVAYNFNGSKYILIENNAFFYFNGMINILPPCLCTIILFLKKSSNLLRVIKNRKNQLLNLSSAIGYRVMNQEMNEFM